MSDWVKKVEAEAKGLLAEAEEELTVLEGVDTIDPLADDDPAPEDGTKRRQTDPATRRRASTPLGISVRWRVVPVVDGFSAGSR